MTGVKATFIMRDRRQRGAPRELDTRECRTLDKNAASTITPKPLARPSKRLKNITIDIQLCYQD